MRIRARLLPILWLSAIGLSVLAGGCWDDDPDPAAGGDAASGGKGGKGSSGKGGDAGCDKAGTGGTGGSVGCSRAGSGGAGGTPGPAGNGPWPSVGQPIHGTCGVPPEPRWGFELYEDAKRVQIPKQGGIDIDAMGMLTEIGEGVPSDLERSRGEDEENLRYVRMQASSHTYTIVAFGTPNLGDALSIGTEVSLSHHDDTCDYILCSAGNVVTTLRAGDVETILFAPTGAASPEGYSIRFGEELCEGRTHCSAWTGHMLEVTSPSGVTLEFTPGEADELGDYTIHAGLLRLHTATNNLESARFECADARSNSAMEVLFFRTFAQ